MRIADSHSPDPPGCFALRRAVRIDATIIDKISFPSSRKSFNLRASTNESSVSISSQ